MSEGNNAPDMRPPGGHEGPRNPIRSASPSRGEAFEAPALVAEDAVLFPEMQVTMAVRDSRNVAATDQAIGENSLAVLIPATGAEGVVESIGTLVLLQNPLAMNGGGKQFTCKGLWRVRVRSVIQDQPYVRVRFTRAEETEDTPSDHPGIMKTVLGQIDEFVELMPGVPPDIISFLKGIDRPGKLADMCGYSPFFSLEERLDLLETLDPEARLEKVSKFFERQLDDLRKLTKAKTIADCATCMDLADRAFESGPNQRARVAGEFLAHVVHEHADELLVLLAQRYGPTFMSRRELR